MTRKFKIALSERLVSDLNASPAPQTDLSQGGRAIKFRLKVKHLDLFGCVMQSFLTWHPVQPFGNQLVGLRGARLLRWGTLKSLSKTLRQYRGS
jgi:hypothetical protein